MNKWAKQKGFTIVELLIVIVLIGILAAITIVAYNGIQQRGRNAQTIAAVNSYKKGFMLYVAANGSYPAANGRFCLGQSTCNGGNMASNATLDAGLRTVMGTNLPPPSNGPGTNTAAQSPLFYTSDSDGQTLEGAARSFIVYTLEGASNCGMAVVTIIGPGLNYSPAQPSSGYTYPNSNGTVTCVALLDKI